MKRFVRIMLFVALAGVLAGTYMYVSAQDSLSGHAGMPAVRGTVNAPAAPPPALTTHTLKGTYFDTGGGITASCSSSGCIATATVFNESIKCPALAGKTCTFQITIESQGHVGGNSGSTGEDGFYQFLVDGVAPSPGPTDSSGLYSWSALQPVNSLANIGTSYAVTATVRNTVANQVHSITQGIGCEELAGDPNGCSATQGFSNFQIAVTTP
jgi:hypothetical protein